MVVWCVFFLVLLCVLVGTDLWFAGCLWACGLLCVVWVALVVWVGTIALAVVV